MSYRFAGVLCHARLSDVQRLNLSDLFPLKALNASEIASGISVVYDNGYRQNDNFLSFAVRLSLYLSTQFDNALLVIYNDQTGQRISVHYIKGEENSRFTVDDEIFIPLDEQGEPVLSAKRLTLYELDEDEEYETVENAIELGLKKFGGLEWSVLKTFITS